MSNIYHKLVEIMEEKIVVISKYLQVSKYRTLKCPDKCIFIQDLYNLLIDLSGHDIEINIAKYDLSAITSRNINELNFYQILGVISDVLIHDNNMLKNWISKHNGCASLQYST